MKAIFERTVLDLKAFELPEALLTRIGQLKAADIVNNVATGKQGNGRPIKKNKPATIAGKKMRGLGNRPLVDELHRFLDIKTYQIRINKQNVEVLPVPEYEPSLHVLVQEKGYRGWLGSSKLFRSALRGLLRKYIQTLTQTRTKRKT